MQIWTSLLLLALVSASCNTSNDCQSNEYCHNNWCYPKQENIGDCFKNEGCLSDHCHLCYSSVTSFLCQKCDQGLLPFGAKCNYTQQCHTTVCKIEKDGKYCLGSLADSTIWISMMVAFSILIIGLILILSLERKWILVSGSSLINVLLELAIILCSSMVLYLKTTTLEVIMVFFPNILCQVVMFSGSILHKKANKISCIMGMLILVFSNGAYCMHHLLYYQVSSEYMVSFLLVMVLLIVNEGCLGWLFTREYNKLFIKTE